jgi:hypothetical protein
VNPTTVVSRAIGRSADSTLIPNVVAHPETSLLPTAPVISKTPGQVGYGALRCHGLPSPRSGSQARNGGSIPLTRSR